MNEYFAHHAFFAIQAVRNGTSGYGPPEHDRRDPLSRRPKKAAAPRSSRRPRRAVLAALRPAARAPH